ncbi:hypothetical protein M2146_002567 [Lachnospiraceae bacterium PF1-22]
MNERISRKNMKKLASEIVRLLVKEDMFENVAIYADNTRLSDTKRSSDDKEITINDITCYVNDCDVTQVVEYSNPKTVTMTFEGALYDAINEGFLDVEEKLNVLGTEYGLFVERGHAWSLAFYEV